MQIFCCFPRPLFVPFLVELFDVFVVVVVVFFFTCVYYWDTCSSPFIKCLCFFVVFFFFSSATKWKNCAIVPRGHWALDTMTTNCDPMRFSHADHACYLNDD